MSTNQKAVEEMNRVLEKVRKLRALATSSNANEAAAAAAAAARLIQAHRLAEAEVEAETGEHEDAVEADTPLAEWARVQNWQIRLARVLCRQYGVSSYLQRRAVAYRRVVTVQMVGRPSDVSTVRYEYEASVRAVARLARNSSDRNSFCLGAVQGIVAQIGRVTEQVVAGASGQTAVVLASRIQRADELRDSLHPDLRTRALRSSRVNRDAYDEGRRAGGDLARQSGVGRQLGLGAKRLGPGRAE